MSGTRRDCSRLFSARMPNSPLFIGDKTVISLWLKPKRLGKRSTKSCSIFVAASSGLSALTKKASEFAPELESGITGTWLLLISCAMCVIADSSALRNNLERQTRGTSLTFNRSHRKSPGPTLGNWSASPTTITRTCFSKASKREEASSRSIIELSSTIKTSSSKGCFAQ